MRQKKLYIGVMSGTSMDGVDTVLVEIEHDKLSLIAHDCYLMPESIKQQLLAVCQGQSTNLKTIGELDHQLGILFADAVLSLLQHPHIQQLGYHAQDIVAIGNHGQTVFHQPTGEHPFTLQLGDANIIAVKTGITTVADFRRKDMALGGQGAPLVPAFHQTLFAAQDSTVVVANIGGIANISVIFPSTASSSYSTELLGYDTGPGNVLMDSWIMKQCGKKYDHHGLYGRSGYINNVLLSLLMEDDYLTLPPPKSTGRELFNLTWLEQKLSQFAMLNHLSNIDKTPLTNRDSSIGEPQCQISPQDVQATLTEFTALTMAKEIEQYQHGEHCQLYLCGGGAKNSLLLERLCHHLPAWQVALTDNKGIDSDYMEAMAFAWLAYRRIEQLPNSASAVTGAQRSASLGVIYSAD